VQHAHLAPGFFVASADLGSKPAFHSGHFGSELVFKSVNPRRKFVESVHVFLEQCNTTIEPWRRHVAH
jgi:hypothetical protein